jgi:hypothetical protein
MHLKALKIIIFLFHLQVKRHPDLN